MRVLIVHNYYGSRAPSGEDVVVEAEEKLLESRGVDVVRYIRRNDEIYEAGAGGAISAARSVVWSERTCRDVADALAGKDVQLAHVHNTFPLISPSVYSALRSAGIPVVQTLHNYRLVCPGGLLMRQGVPCEECVGGSLFSGIAHRCYRKSAAATAAVALMLWRNRRWGTYNKLVDKYICLTEFARKRFVAGGLPETRLCVRGNVVPGAPEMGTGEGGYALFVGRLSEEKGIRTLVNAWGKLQGISLWVIGEGPLGDVVRDASSSRGDDIRPLGKVTRDRVLAHMRDAAFVIVPSESYEGFPLVIGEAFACGTPVIASRIGGLPEIVSHGETGLLFQAGDADSLAGAVRTLQDQPDVLLRMRQRARAEYEAKYTEEQGFRSLMSIYEDVLRTRGGFRSGGDAAGRSMPGYGG